MPGVVKKDSRNGAVGIPLLLLVTMLLQPAYAQNSTFLQNWYWTVEGTNYYILNKNVVHNHLDSNKDLFYFPRNGAIVYVDANTVLSFIADPSWSRIVYGEYGGDWVKSFGSYGSGLGQFKHPASVATDGLGNLYVADTGNSRVISLSFDAANNEIDPNSFRGHYDYVLHKGKVLHRPWDLDVDDKGNTDPSDDWIWVVDNRIGQIVPFHGNGGAVIPSKIITSLAYGATVYDDLQGLSGIAIRKQAPASPSQIGVNSTDIARLYVVDKSLRKLLLVDLSTIGSTVEGRATVVYEKTFASDVVLSGVESDYFGDAWVVDNANGKIYKYTWDGGWLEQVTGLNYPTSVASTRRHHLTMAITENWTNTTGSRTYFHGARINNLAIATSTTAATFSFVNTNFSRLTSDVDKDGEPKQILLLDELHPSGPMTINWYQSNPEAGYYTYAIRSDTYDNDNTDYHLIEQNFYFKPKVTISGPGSMGYTEKGTYATNVTGGSTSTTSYQWYRKYDGSSTWYTLGTSSTQTVTMGKTSFTLKVVVSRGDDNAQDTHYVKYSGGTQELKRIVSLPEAYALVQNYPNPFNPVTTIKYDLPENSSVTLRVYNLMGEEVKTLVKGTVDAGYQNVIWNGKDSNGNPVSSGMYLYRLNVNSRESEQEFHMTRKMVLLR